MNSNMFVVDCPYPHELIIVFRGTILYNLKDKYSKAIIAIKGPPSIFDVKAAYDCVNAQLVSLNGSAFTVTITGHSLGGYIAECFAQKYIKEGNKNVKCVSFNAAFSKLSQMQKDIAKGFDFPKYILENKPVETKTEGIIGFHIKGDLISNGSHLGDRVDFDGQPSFPAHTMDNFMLIVNMFQLKAEKPLENPDVILQRSIEEIKQKYANIDERECSICKKKLIDETYDDEGNGCLHIKCMIKEANEFRGKQGLELLVIDTHMLEEAKSNLGGQNPNEEIKVPKTEPKYFCV